VTRFPPLVSAGLVMAERSAFREILRECRRLGSDWSPRPPASHLLWGRGFKVEASAQHPLLVHITPSGLREGLPCVTGGHPFRLWLNRRLRSSWNCTSKATASFLEDARQFLRLQGDLKACTCHSQEQGLQLEAVSGFVHMPHGQNGQSHFMFAYNMRFTNLSDRPLRVLGRQYDFVESSGSLASQIKPEQPEAAGVVGFTPLLAPGAVFEFGSGVVLNSPSGLVTGRFLVMEEPELSGEDAQVHSKMEEAELMVRFVYFKGLGTPQFYMPLPTLRFDSEVPCANLKR